MSAANLDQTIAAYAMEAPAIRASSGGAFYLFLMNPASVSYTHLDVYKRQIFRHGGKFKQDVLRYPKAYG